MDKPFIETSVLIHLMTQRGIEVDSDTELRLTYDSYYSIINGYKNLFIAKGKRDIYKKGTKFKEIISLYEFDRDIRNLFLTEFMRAESFIKNIIYYEFYKEFGDGETYLDKANYSNDPRLKETLNKTIALMKNIIRENSHSKTYNAIKHYKQKYNHIPYWVLMKFLTFRNIFHIYKGLKGSTQTAIAIRLTKINHKHINIGEIYRMLRCFSGLRNICAHENIFYTCSISKGATPYYAYESLNNCLMETNYIYFTLRLALLINSFRKAPERQIIQANSVLKKMGFPSNWDTMILTKYATKKGG